MKTLTRQKRYKALPPMETVNRARRILQDCDLFTVEHQTRFEKPVLTTFRVWLGDEDMNEMNLGTNGKGMTFQYALASAYGEMMERLQNGLLLPQSVRNYLYCGSHSVIPETWKEWLKTNDADLEYFYFPDEQWLTMDELLDSAEEVLKAVLKVDREELLQLLQIAYEDKEILCTPYYDLVTDTTYYLPEVLMYLAYASNGMCAGNTEKEAAIQGLAEIYERYAIKIAYDNPDVEIPVIEDRYFDGTLVADMLRDMQATGITYEILDMSMGIGLPVVGLRVWKDGGRTIAVHVGSDPSPITALERCITELYQISPEKLDIRFHDYREALKNEVPDKSDEEKWLFWRKERAKYFVNGTGLPPKTLLVNSGAVFQGFSHPDSTDNDSDFDYMIEVGKSICGHILMQNNSFLGFPAFKIILPGISDLFLVDLKSNFDLAAQCKIYNHAVTISRLPSATREEVAAFVEIWKEQMSYKKTDEIGLGFMAPPGTSFPESFNEEAGIDAVLSEYLDSGKDPSEFFSDKEYPNCCQNNCDNCNSLGGCCLLAVGKKMKGIQEKQKTFVSRTAGNKKRGEIA